MALANLLHGSRPSPGELRAAMSMARLWRGRPTIFSPPVYGWFTEGFDTWT
jgi:hypothetical protein